MNVNKLITKAAGVSMICLMVACTSSKNINRDFLYFQRGLDSIGNIQLKENVIKINDVLSIQVRSKSRNQEQTALFNMATDSSSGISGYQVNNAGSIDVPTLGFVKVTGLTRYQLQTLLTEKLSTYVKDPLVRVSFASFTVNVLGEVKSPGTKPFLTDKVSIFDAISAAGDLTEFGKKDNVMVIREENGRRNYYNVDLRSGAVFQSPVYLLQPNDIVYVEPNEIRLKAINIDPQKEVNRRNVMFFISLGITTITLVATLIRLN